MLNEQSNADHTTTLPYSYAASDGVVRRASTRTPTRSLSPTSHTLALVPAGVRGAPHGAVHRTRTAPTHPPRAIRHARRDRLVGS